MSSLIGVWLFTAMIYQGNKMDPANPHLKIYYNFMNESENEIYYFRDNESGFCRRWANYEVKDGQLIQVVTKADPDNHSSCSSDTDMQVGNKSTTPIKLQDKQIYLSLPLGEEELIYIFDNVQ